MKTKSIVSASLCLLLALGLSLGSVTPAFAHCQIPCGIYDDGTRIALLKEHITTIKKSMNLIVELSEDPGKNANQLVRWVNNKEAHADEFAGIVVKYFLQQRIKPTEEDRDAYTKKVVLCHEMLVNTMKAKQTTDAQYVEKLDALVNEFAKAYFSGEDLDHLKEHGLVE